MNSIRKIGNWHWTTICCLMAVVRKEKLRQAVFLAKVSPDQDLDWIRALANGDPSHPLLATTVLEELEAEFCDGN